MSSRSQKDRASPEIRFPDYLEDWDNIRLKDVADIKRGAGSQYLTYVPTEEEGVRLIRIGDFLGSDPVFVEDTKDMVRFRLQRDDILIAGTGATAGITFKVPEEFIDFAFSYNAPRIRVKESESDFVISYLKSEVVLRQQHRLFTGNAQPFLDTAAIGGFKMRVPTLPEQKKIADFLTSVDERIGQLIKKKALLEDYKKGVMQQLFSQQIRFKDDNGNDFPDWEEKTIDEIANFRRGSFPQPYGLKKWYDDENGFPFIQVYDVGNNFRLKDETKRQISDLAKDLSVFVPKGSIVITIQGSIGRIAVTQYDACCDRTLLIFTEFKVPIAEVYFVYALYLRFEIEARIAVGGTIKTITKEKLRVFPINLPSVAEQTKIADFLTSVDQKVERVSQQIAKTQTFKKGLLQQMFV